MLDVRRVSKRYGSIRALSDVSLTVDRGEIVAVVGENGAGKSTLVRCIAAASRPDTGWIAVEGLDIGHRPRDVIERGVAVVWQDLALCDNLDVPANLFLGRELDRFGTLDSGTMFQEATAVFAALGVALPGFDRPIEQLSGGQRQLVAIARAMLNDPEVLVLDEPTASLGVAEGQAVLDVVRTLRTRGVAILLVSHSLDSVFDVADRIAVLRHGRLVADLHRAETHPDDVVALITGSDVDTTAGQQLRRLHSLAEQLADADESAVLPLTVSSLSSALGTERLAIFLVEERDGQPELRRSASLHLPPSMAEELATIPIDNSTFVGRAATSTSLVVARNLRTTMADRVADLASAHGLAGAWAAPIVGQSGPIAVIAGFHVGVAPLQEDQTRLLELFSTMAGAAIERGRLVEVLRRRNRALENIRGVLETLAGPGSSTSGLVAALDALCRGAGSETAALYSRESGAAWSVRAKATGENGVRLPGVPDVGSAADPSVVVATFGWSRGQAALVCQWPETAPAGHQELVDDAANSFRLALERELTLQAEQEAAALQRSRELERGITLRLGHELRTPLTAIRGFASTMLQPDVTWPESEKERFLTIIEREAGRMSRLVAQLFDDTAIESGALRLQPNYYDLVTVITQAASIAAPPESIILDLPAGYAAWGDRDRIEQVFVNLIGNAMRHNAEGTTIRVRLAPPPRSEMVSIDVSDDGVGLPPEALAFLNGELIDRAKDEGLGLRVIRGLVAAHGGSIGATVDGGTTVTVTLPVDRPNQP